MRFRIPFLLVCLAGFLWALFLLQNLPFTFGDDLNILDQAKGNSWSVLIKAVFNPLTPAWYVHGASCQLTTRAFQTLLFRMLFQFFGYEPNVFQALKATAFAGCGGLIFLFCGWLTQSRLSGVAAGLFFYLLPPVYQSLSWIADPEILAQMFVLMSFLCFLHLYTQPEKFRPLSSFALILFLVASAWLGMKLKETARIIPFVLLGFMVCDQRLGLLKGIKNSAHRWLLGSSILLLGTVIPWKSSPNLPLDERSHWAIFKPDPHHFALTLLPVIRLTAGLLVLLLLGFALSRLRDARKPIDTPPFARPRVLLFLALWTALCLAGYTLNFRLVNNNRYLTTLLIPVTILAFSLFGRSLLSLSQRPKKVLQTLFVIWLVVSLQRNLDEVLFIRNFYGGVDIADYLLTQKLYEDRFHKQKATWQDLDTFYRDRTLLGLEETNAIRIKEWDEGRQVDLRRERLKRAAQKWGSIYILSFKEDLFQNEPRARLIFKGTTDNHSLYNRLLAPIKKKVNRPIYLYQYR